MIDGTASSSNQSITADVHSDFTFFVSHASGVYYVSLAKWIGQLESELSEPQSEGADFRLKRLLDSATTVVEQHIRRKQMDNFTSCVVMEDGNVGYLVLTTTNNVPQAVLLDAPEDGVPTDEELAEFMEFNSPAGEIREPWQPPQELWQPFDLYASLDIPNRHKSLLREEIRLSPASLEVLMSAHRALAAHSDKLQHAVSDLFNRCQRLQDEYRDQIVRVASLVPKIDAVTGSDGTGSEPDAYGSAVIADRLDRVKTRQEELRARYQALQRKMSSVGGTELSEKEVAFAEELQTMEGSVDRAGASVAEVDDSDSPAWQRLGRLKDMKDMLSKDVKQAVTERHEERSSPGMKVPSHSRRQENEQIEAMLQHVTNITEAMTNRLRSAGVSIAPVPTSSSA